MKHAPRMHPSANIFDSDIGHGTTVAAFVEIGGATVGEDCAIQAFSFLCRGTVIGHGVFIGPRVTFTNDRHPRPHNHDYVCEGVTIGDYVSIGASVTFLPGVKVGPRAKIGAGSLICKDVPADAVVTGVWK